MTKRANVVLSSFILVLLSPVFLAAQDGLQLNVPYLCPDGSTYVVHSCTRTAKGEFCNYQANRDSERYNLRVYVANQMRTCQIRGAAATQPSGTKSGDYTDDMPSVQRVESAIQGKDATDSMARQIVALRALSEYINTIKEVRTVRGPYTPSEANLRAQYEGAAEQLVQSYARSHTPAETAEFNRVTGKYNFDRGLYDDYHRLIGPRAAAASASAQANLDAGAERERQRTIQMMNPGQGRPGGSPNSSAGSADDFFAQQEAKLENDPQIRRCLELGGGVDECEGTDTAGMAETAENLARKLIGEDPRAGLPASGVLLVGQFHSRSELPEITLTSDGKAILQKCGTLVDESHTYTLRRSGAATQVIIANEPAAIVLSLGPDGSLVGPGNVTVKGQVISGYRNDSRCTAGMPATTCRTNSLPVYAPSMQRCTLGQLAALPPSAPKADPNAGFAKMLGISTRTPVATTYGLRLVGTYASPTGMKLAFSNRYVTIDCRKAHVNAPYAVENTPSGFVVRVQNAGGAFALAVGSDDTLRGSGSTTVTGKLVSSFHGENVSFTPDSESCAVGVFSPQR